mmetsp:Transcript_34463/g.80008  ORF Transcript_34463/g.80008 Transcript_34463/m.80008 type:complete len:389 (+) Transcript_34463:73-1239(+)
MIRSVTTAVVFAHGMWGVSSEGSVSLCGKTYSHTWNTKASMLAARSDMTATTVGDAIYLIGGCTMDQVWVTGPYPSYACGGGLPSAISGKTTAYLPAGDEHRANLPDAPRARYRHAAAEVGGKIYLFGGTNGSEAIVQHVDVFDTATSTWSTLPEAFLNATTDNAAFAHGGKIYIVGGYDAQWSAKTTTYIFDPSKAGLAAWTMGPEMQQGRGDFSALMVGDSAFAIGGFHDGNNFEAPLETIERLDVGAGATKWMVRKAMSTARGDKAVAAVNGALHVVGGEGKSTDGHSVPLQDVEVYHPDCNEWKEGGDIPSKRFRFTAASHDQSLYIFGGQGYLEGTYGTAASKYPLMSKVEEFSETVKETPLTSAAASSAAVCAALSLVASFA